MMKLSTKEISNLLNGNKKTRKLSETYKKRSSIRTMKHRSHKRKTQVKKKSKKRGGAPQEAGDDAYLANTSDTNTKNKNDVVTVKIHLKNGGIVTETSSEGNNLKDVVKVLSSSKPSSSKINLPQQNNNVDTNEFVSQAQEDETGQNVVQSGLSKLLNYKPPDFAKKIFNNIVDRITTAANDSETPDISKDDEELIDEEINNLTDIPELSEDDELDIERELNDTYKQNSNNTCGEQTEGCPEGCRKPTQPFGNCSNIEKKGDGYYKKCPYKCTDPMSCKYDQCCNKCGEVVFNVDEDGNIIDKNVNNSKNVVKPQNTTTTKVKNKVVEDTLTAVNNVDKYFENKNNANSVENTLQKGGLNSKSTRKTKRKIKKNKIKTRKNSKRQIRNKGATKSKVSRKTKQKKRKKLSKTKR